MPQNIFAPLARVEAKRIKSSNLIPSAVLLPVFHADNQYHVLFIKRSETVAHHKGEISFPGGVVDPEDLSCLHTALRESNEEVGIAPEDVQVLGRLDDMETVSTGFVITPFVGLIPYPYDFRINADEIAMLVIVPLDTLIAVNRDGNPAVLPGENRVPVPVFPIEGHVIWGATARILLQFLDVIRHPFSTDIPTVT